MGDRVLLTIGAVAQTAFWAVGYFVGFTLVGLLSLGTILSEPFNDIGRYPHRRRWRILFRKHGRYYVIAEAVALLGWIFLGCLGTWLWRLN